MAYGDELGEAVDVEAAEIDEGEGVVAGGDPTKVYEMITSHMQDILTSVKSDLMYS